MKLLNHLSLLVTTVAALGVNAALADDSQLPNRLDRQRSQFQPQSTTIGAYENQRGIGAIAVQPQNADAQYEVRTDAHGHTFSAFVPAQ